MSDVENFADLKFRIECSDMMLHDQDRKVPIARGPGEIWQDSEGQLQYKIFINRDAYHAVWSFIMRPGFGEIISSERYLTLTVQTMHGSAYLEIL